MSTLAEIESAIEHLPVVEREALESRLLSRRFGLNALDAAEHAALIASLDAAEIDFVWFTTKGQVVIPPGFASSSTSRMAPRQLFKRLPRASSSSR